MNLNKEITGVEARRGDAYILETIWSCKPSMSHNINKQHQQTTNNKQQKRQQRPWCLNVSFSSWENQFDALDGQQSLVSQSSVGDQLSCNKFTHHWSRR